MADLGGHWFMLLRKEQDCYECEAHWNMWEKINDYCPVGQAAKDMSI